MENFNISQVSARALELSKALPIGGIVLTAINPYVGGAWVALQVGRAVSEAFRAPDCSDGFYALFVHVCTMYGYESLSRAALMRAYSSLDKKGYVIKCGTEEEFADWLSDLQNEDEALRAKAPARTIGQKLSALATA
jgi:hypothetical protein